MAEAWKRKKPRFPKKLQVDPYIDWALDLAEGMPQVIGKGALPILVRLNGISANEFALAKGFIDDFEARKKWKRSVRVPRLYTRPATGLEGAVNCTALVTDFFFDQLISNARLGPFVSQITLGLPLGQEALPKPRRAKSPAKGRS